MPQSIACVWNPPGELGWPISRPGLLNETLTQQPVPFTRRFPELDEQQLNALLTLSPPPDGRESINEHVRMGTAQPQRVGFRASGRDSRRCGLGSNVGSSEDLVFRGLSASSQSRLASGGPVFLHWVRSPSGDGIFCLKRVSDFSDGH